jgi:hypothetical protein
MTLRDPHTADHPADQDAPASRYGCLECQEDAELAVGERLHPGAEARYRAHLRGCPDCRRRHYLLEAVYRGPDASGLGVVARDREFAAILRRVPLERPQPLHHRVLQTTGVVALATTAAALATMLLVGPRSDLSLEDAPLAGISAALSTRAAGDSGGPAAAEPTGPDHQAQVDYGRVIAGRGFLSARGEGPPVLTDVFTVGTRFSIDQGQSLQVGFLGRILANFDPGTEIEWTHASPAAFDLTLERGFIAVRYERDADDPVLNIHTPSALVRVVGTVFTVAVDAEGRTDVAVLRGKVEVCNPEDQAVVAEVGAGYRFDLERATYADLGRDEVRLAMPLSDEGDPTSADGTVPASWVVPGLPTAPELRRLENILARASQPRSERPAAPRSARRYNGLLAPAKDDDGQSLIDKLVRDADEARRERGLAALERCKALYQSAQTRYLSARCLTEFMAEHGDEEDFVEGHLLIGILRMDFANDYPAAQLAFQRFLERAPGHPEAELARYRLWLANTELGDIHAAIDRGREYLHRYPNGKYAGKILQRFPRLVSEL